MIQISDAEMEIMKTLWVNSPLTSPELVEAARANNDWETSTIVTLLNRLVKKGAVAQEGARRSYRYRPLIEPGEYVKSEFGALTGRVFGASKPGMLAFFLENEDLSADEIAQIRQILDSKEQK
ncbi:MAG: BlaI/MecI/CopY family transcriptional regulator [Victivallaceae bacterium]|nr:BlaI/MecI/CopY family transcriptional regulator [Victivallaceae bacterium]